MSGKCQVNVKSQSELDIGGRETCDFLLSIFSLIFLSLCFAVVATRVSSFAK